MLTPAQKQGRGRKEGQVYEALSECVQDTAELSRLASFDPTYVPIFDATLARIEELAARDPLMGIRRAAKESREFFQRWLSDRSDPMRYRDILHLPSRGRWIKSEYEAALGTGPASDLPALRWLLEPGRSGFPRMVAFHGDFRRALERLGGERYLDLLGAGRERAGVATCAPRHQGLVGLDRFDLLTGEEARAVSFLDPRKESAALHDRIRFETFSAVRPPPFSLIGELESINSALLIDPSRQEPQEGLGRLLDTKTMQDWWFKSPTAHLFVLRLDGKAEGYLMLFPTPESWPESGNTAIRYVAGSNFSQPGWVEMVAISRGAREVFKENETGGYAPLRCLALEAALNLNVDALYCMVREGPTANTAKSKHLREGFCDLRIRFDFHGTSYSVLGYDIEDAVDQRIVHLACSSWGQELLKTLTRLSAV